MPTDEKIMDKSTNFGPEQNFNEYDDSMGTYQSDEPEVTPFVEPAESEFQGKKIKRKVFLSRFLTFSFNLLKMD